MKKHLFTGLLAVALIASIAVVGQTAEKEDKAEAKKPINDKCPLSGRDVNPEKTSEVKISFCCNNCKGKFDKDPGAFIAKVKTLDKCPLSGRDVSEKANTTIKVAMCCGNCKGKFDKDPTKFIAKVKVKKEESDKKG